MFRLRGRRADRIEITALLKEIELCRSDIDRPAIATDSQAPAKCPTRRVDI